jgi:mannose-6-phosphate isomerase-like protein (cupin superfamily)
MKIVLILATLLAAAVMMTGADGKLASYFDAAKVTAALTKGGMLVQQSDLSVQGAHRTAAGQVEVHDKETDVFYVTDGEATIVVGGTMVGGKQKSPGQMLGTSIEGGETHHVSKGDSMVIPAGVPHWFKEVPKSISYFVVKVIAP